MSATRRAVLAMLRDQPEPTTLAALARLADLHENTIRGHLDALVRLGLVHREQAPPEGRGRPAWRYALTEAALGAGPSGSEPVGGEYAALASVLAASLARTSDDPEQAGTDAGADWGRQLAHDRGTGPMPPAAAEVAVRDLLDDLGFAPESVPDEGPQELRLTRCPLLEAAYRNPEVVCGVHRGIVQGAYAELGFPDTRATLVPFAEPGACRLTLPDLGADA